ncbi:MAG: sugar nucleotide-binding protein [Verrucomicrobia bacterium]|jgi:dTDP-4-dehydrorhamnose reductase|nr:sugar nucleotide-binding protein [Verrucomicrobiota bacterium]
MIIILGATGYVGSAYCQYFESRNISYAALSRKDVDYTQLKPLSGFLKKIRPEFLINAAGYTGKPNVDACEDHKAECLAGNAVFPGTVQEACRQAGVRWGHVSSGCIYSGTRPGGGGFREDDPPNFSFRQNHCSFYSGTKALGEEALGYREIPAEDRPLWGHDSSPNGYIWRLRIPFDHHENPRNYLTKLIRYQKLLEATNSLSQLHEFVAATFECWEKRIPMGIYNVTNPGRVTTSEVVDLIRKTGVCTKNYEFFDNEDDFMAKAARAPRSNCVLDTSKLERAGIRMTEVHEAVEQSLRRWVPAS